MSRFLIVGLGNIGSEYIDTRHNIGFNIVEALADKYQAPFRPGRLADIASFSFKGRTVLAIKPTTYMNLSGKAVRYWTDKEKIPIAQTLVVVDDVALPLSKLRLRPSGSDGGHNGLSSVQEALGSVSYPRLRFGIGNEYPRGMQIEFVLGKWNTAEWPLVKLKIEKSVEVIENFMFIGIERTMTEVNKKDFML